MSKTVVVRSVGEVVVLEMNRPEKRNAMNFELVESLVRELRAVAVSDQASAVVITGAGGAFSAGADIKEQDPAISAAARHDGFTALYELVTGFPKPTVAAIAGPCIGGGAEVAAACDLRVGTPGAGIRFPGAALGIPVGVSRLPLLVGESHARDLLLTARTIDGLEALRFGFLNRLVEEKELEHEAVALAAGMAANPGSANTKRLLAEASDLIARVAKENRELGQLQPQAEPEKRKGASG